MKNSIIDFNKELRSIKNLEVINHSSDLKKLSRDFYNYSPILTRLLDGCLADVVVRPKDNSAIEAVVKKCWDFDIPLTLRGSGTGNYGQSVPLFNGVVMQMNYLNKVEDFCQDTGFVKVQAGCLMSDLNKKLENHGRELRLYPSTWRTATIGGFISGGSGGIGSIRWGFLRDPGNLIGLDVITMNAKPQMLYLTSGEADPFNHAYGTNGIITSLLLPTAIKIDWYSVIVDCEDLEKAIFLLKSFTASAIELKLGAILEKDIVKNMPIWFSRHSSCHKLLIQCTLGGIKTIEFVCKKNKVKYVNLGKESDLINGINEVVWNHTTLQMRARDKTWTYLQMLLPLENELNLIDSMRREFGKNILWHIEAVSQQGVPRLAALPVIKCTNEIDILKMMDRCKELGAIIFNPHALTVEEGGLGVIDADQVKAKLKYDPKGLLNPGKLKGWETKENFMN